MYAAASSRFSPCMPFGEESLDAILAFDVVLLIRMDQCLRNRPVLVPFIVFYSSPVRRALFKLPKMAERSRGHLSVHFPLCSITPGTAAQQRQESLKA